MGVSAVEPTHMFFGSVDSMFRAATVLVCARTDSTGSHATEQSGFAVHKEAARAVVLAAFSRAISTAKAKKSVFMSGD
jgi:hypothetical protein